MKDLSNDLIIGWPTLKGTGLLAIVLGLEEYELEEDKDDDGLGELWEASEDPTYGPPIRALRRGAAQRDQDRTRHFSGV